MAGVSLVAFLALALYLLVDIEAAELTWSRRVYVFGAVEAVAFAGVGWLFGREVHRERAEVAEDRAASAEQKADSRTEEAKANAIAATKFRDRGVLLREELRTAAGSTQTRGPGSPIQDLARKAETLFPED